jgi:tetratricopeptide (TPR) repeat protein
MRLKPPPTERKFAHPWKEIDYLYHKALYWWFEREDRRRAFLYAERLRPLLEREDARSEAILGAASRALIAELDGNLNDAIRHRIHEIELIRRLNEIGGPPSILFGPDDIADRLDLLAILYWHSGELEKAEQTLEESRRLCEQHKIPFDGTDLLKDVRRDKALSQPRRKIAV